MLSDNEPQRQKPPKPVRRRSAQPAPELDTRAAEMRLRQSSTKEETELAEEHLRLLRLVELSGPGTPTWVAVTAYLVLVVACATSRIASVVGLDAIVSTALAKVSRCQATHFRRCTKVVYSHSRLTSGRMCWRSCYCITWSAQAMRSSSLRKLATEN